MWTTLPTAYVVDYHKNSKFMFRDPEDYSTDKIIISYCNYLETEFRKFKCLHTVVLLISC